MELICNKCGYKRDVGNTIQTQDFVAENSGFFCTECESYNMRLVDSGGVNIKVDGITEDTIINIVKELSKSISISDVIGFLGKKKKE